MSERFAKVIELIEADIEDCRQLSERNWNNSSGIFDPFDNACGVEKERRVRLEELKITLSRAPEETPEKIEIPSFVSVLFDDEEETEDYLVTSSETRVDVLGFRSKVVSDKTAFGMSIIGKEAGEKFAYEVGKGGARDPILVTGKIIHIK